MAPGDRAEHRLMRQRGAGISNASNTTFSFNFGRSAAPARKQKSQSRSPAKLPSQPSSRKTPQPLAPELSTRNTPRLRTPRANGNAAATIPNTRVSSSKAKIAQDLVEDKENETLFVTPTVTGKRRRGSNTALAQEGREQDDLAQDDPEYVSSADRRGMSARRASTVSSGAPELLGSPLVEEDQLAAIGDYHMSSASKSTQRSVISQQVSRTPIPSAAKQGNRARGPLSQHGTQSATATTIDLEAEDELSPEQVVFDRSRIESTRRSSHLLAPRDTEQRTLDGISPIGTGRRNHKHVRRSGLVFEDRDDPQSDRGDDSNDTSNGIPQSTFVEQENEPDSDLRSRELSAPLRPSGQSLNRKRPSIRSKISKATKKMRKKVERVRESAQAESGEKRRKTERGHVKIKVLRLTHPIKRKPSEDNASGEESSDPLQDPSSFSVPGVSGADVLRNTIMETLDKNIDKLRGMADDEIDDRIATQHKRNASYVTKFKYEVMARLRPIIDRVDTGTRLKLDLKNKQRQKTRLREELLGLKKQHDEIVLKMDAVREEHQKRSDEHKKHLMLNEALFDIEFAVQNGRQRAMEQGREHDGPDMPLDMLMANVASVVSSRQPGGGLLERVTEFNDALEKCADIIEGRA